jgi:hypothetical protein
MKGHGLLHWSTGPPQRPAPFVIEIYPSPVHVEYRG